MFVSLWSLALFLFTNDYKNEFTRWISLTVFIGGCASFGVCVHLFFLPELSDSMSNFPNFLEGLHILGAAVFGLYLFFLPYVYLVMAIVFSELFNRKFVRMFKLTLFFPPLYLLITHFPDYPVIIYDTSVVRVMAGLYYLTGSVIIFWSSFRETNVLLKRNKLRTGVFFTGILTWIYISDDWGIKQAIMGPNGMEFISNNLWKYNWIVIVLLVIFFVFFSLRYGFLGIKLKVEKQRSDYSKRVLTKGVSILNHSIKNEIQKINYLCERAKDHIDKGQKEEAITCMDRLLPLTGHLQEMVDRIKEKSGEIILKEADCLFSQIADSVLDGLLPIMNEKKLVLVRNYETDAEAKCDPSHIREVINNICLNAIEVMKPGEGILEISMQKVKRELWMIIKDNGPGMSKENMTKVFAPFFTTKKGSHYGLGLSYSYNVMQKHRGELMVLESEIGKGTTFLLRFPSNRILRFTERVEQGEIFSTSPFPSS